MTLPYDFETAGSEQEQGPDENYPVAIPVRVMFNETEVVAPAFSSWTGFTVQPGGRPVRVCPHRYHRDRARFLVTFAPASTSKLYVARTEDYLSSGSVANAFVVSAGQNIPDYDGQQPVYVYVTGPDPVIVCVLDQGHGEVQ